MTYDSSASDMSREFRIEEHPAVLMRPRVSFPYAWVGHIPFAYLAIDLLRPRSFVELGTDSGNSYLAFCQAVQALELSTQCTAIDSWEGDEHARRYGDEIYLALRARHDPLYARFSRLLRSSFDDALTEFADASIDLLHIDGLHTYAAVSHDFESWLPKLSDRAVVLLHDTNVHEREFGVWKFFAEVTSRYPTFAFRHSSGLGVVAVGNDVPKPFQEFLRSANAGPAIYRTFFERLADTLINAEDMLPVAGISVETSAIAHLYYRSKDEPFDEMRMVSRSLPAMQGTLDLNFVLPAGVDIDYLRFDPIDLPGVFNLISMCLTTAKGESSEVSDLQRRLGRVNGSLLEPIEGAVVRLATFGEDPYLEFEVGDLLAGLAANTQLEVALRVTYEAVVDDPSARRLLGSQAEALSNIREVAARHIDIRSIGREIANDQRETNLLQAQTREQLSALSDVLRQTSVQLQSQTEQWEANLQASARDQLATFGEALAQTHAQLHAQAAQLQRDASSQSHEQQAMLSRALAQIQSHLNMQSEQSSRNAQTQNEQLQHIEGRLDQLEKRSLWSLIKPTRG